jgi:hypothetical protein
MENVLSGKGNKPALIKKYKKAKHNRTKNKRRNEFKSDKTNSYHGNDVAPLLVIYSCQIPFSMCQGYRFSFGLI